MKHYEYKDLQVNEAEDRKICMWCIKGVWNLRCFSRPEVGWGSKAGFKNSLKKFAQLFGFKI